MASIVFYVGEQPSTPLIITVHNSDGTPRDLTDYDAVSVEGEGLPAGASAINDAPAGKVQYDFTDPFDEAGVLSVRVKMEGPETGEVDYSDTVDITVKDQTETSTALLTPAEVEAMVGTAVSLIDVIRAQGIISLLSGRDLSDADWLADEVSSRDLFWLKMAVSYQAAAMRERATAGVLPIAYVAGATSVKNGDVTVSFGSGDATSESLDVLDALAKTALKRLSWMQGQRTVHATPFIGQPRVQPDPWVLLYRLGRV